MSRFEIDLSTVESIKLIPDGVYIVRIENWKEKDTQTGGKKILFTSEILEPAEILSYSKRFFFDTPLHPDALFRLKQLYEMAGQIDKTVGGFDPDDLKGCEVGVVVRLADEGFGPRNYVSGFLKAERTKPVLKKKIEDVEALETAAAGATAAGTGAGAGAGEGTGIGFGTGSPFGR